MWAHLPLTKEYNKSGAGQENPTPVTLRAQLTDIQSLKGIVGVRRFVIGCISRSEDGRYLLEDSSGTIPLNLTGVQTAAGFYTGGSGQRRGRGAPAPQQEVLPHGAGGPARVLHAHNHTLPYKIMLLAPMRRDGFNRNDHWDGW